MNTKNFDSFTIALGIIFGAIASLLAYHFANQELLAAVLWGVIAFVTTWILDLPWKKIPQMALMLSSSFSSSFHDNYSQWRNGKQERRKLKQKVNSFFDSSDYNRKIRAGLRFTLWSSVAMIFSVISVEPSGGFVLLIMLFSFIPSVFAMGICLNFSYHCKKFISCDMEEDEILPKAFNKLRSDFGPCHWLKEIGESPGTPRQAVLRVLGKSALNVLLFPFFITTLMLWCPLALANGQTRIKAILSGMGGLICATAVYFLPGSFEPNNPYFWIVTSIGVLIGFAVGKHVPVLPDGKVFRLWKMPRLNTFRVTKY